ncbi:MAG TPA: hypothetical protein VGL46_09550 [Pseudonocardiaceae bacterium]|jgi:hypothetical protein
MFTTTRAVAGALLLGSIITAGTALATAGTAAADPQSHHLVAAVSTSTPGSSEVSPAGNYEPLGTRISSAAPSTREGIVAPAGTRIDW